MKQAVRAAHSDPMGPALEVKNLSISYRTRTGTTNAVDDVSFTINKGEVLGLAGESGCGKSTTVLSIMRLLGSNADVKGQILFEGEDILGMSDQELRDFRWKHVSMIPQGSMNSLDPVIPVGNQLVEAILAHERMGRSQAYQIAQRFLASVSVHPSRARNYPHEFSGGMKQRAVIAMALMLDPQIVIADEPTTALDVVVQRQLLELLKELRGQLGISFLFVTHDLSVISEIADRVAVMYAGKIVEIGDKDAVLKHPSHPYTEALVNAIPHVFGERRQLDAIPGAPPSEIRPTGCSFHPRCKYAFDLCKVREPPLVLSRTGSMAACHLVGEKR